MLLLRLLARLLQATFVRSALMLFGARYIHCRVVSFCGAAARASGAAAVVDVRAGEVLLSDVLV